MKYTDGWRYKNEGVVVQDVPEFADEIEAMSGAYVLLIHSVLTIANQYAWNGASFFLFKWFGTPRRWMLPSLIHDALYQLMREGRLDPREYRAIADGIFYRLLRERGVSWIVAKTAYYAVRLGGNYAMRHGAEIQETL